MDQSTALNILKSGRNVFLTGSAGTGKSYTLNQYIKYLRALRIPVAVTASTGIAASNINGQTIHSWAGLGIKDFITATDIARLRENRFKMDALLKTRVLIVDEISMFHRTQFEMLDTVLRTILNPNKAFGGLQVVFTGDFFQLPPVGKEGQTVAQKFCFMSPSWVAADLHVCYLDVQYRQNSGPLIDILNSIRSQSVTEDQRELLLETDFNEGLDDKPLHLYTHNMSVESLNSRFLAELEDPLKTFIGFRKGPEFLVKSLIDNSRTSLNLELKLNAKVMFVRNDPDGSFCNGTQGIITEFVTEDGVEIPVVTVKRPNGNVVKIIARRMDWTIDDERGNPLALFSQIPLRLAWAITIHKSQGLTLQEAEIDLSRTFEMGQGYVALSRLQSIEGLRLTGLNESALLLDALAIKADKRFMELSAQIEPQYLETNASAFNAFVKRCRSRKFHQ